MRNGDADSGRSTGGQASAVGPSRERGRSRKLGVRSFKSKYVDPNFVLCDKLIPLLYNFSEWVKVTTMENVQKRIQQIEKGRSH